MFEAVNIKHQLISNDCSYLVNWDSGMSLLNCLRLPWHTNTKNLGWFKGVQHFYSLTSLQLLTCTKQFGSTLTCNWSARNQHAVWLRRAAGGRSGKAESENLKQRQKIWAGQRREVGWQELLSVIRHEAGTPSRFLPPLSTLLQLQGEGWVAASRIFTVIRDRVRG